MSGSLSGFVSVCVRSSVSGCEWCCVCVVCYMSGCICGRVDM